MYSLSNINLGNKIKSLRISRGLSLEALGNKICKTKATVSKYEKNEISLDILTLLEICNALNCSISNIISDPYCKSNSIRCSNPFECDKLYIYYITGKKLITSVMELSSESDKINVRLFNAIKDTDKYATNYSYYYNGELIHSNSIVYFSLSNNFIERQLENVNITVNFPWSNNTGVFSAFLFAITPNALPVVKKCIISKNILPNIEKYMSDLLISEDELKKISANNAWILENYNHNHFLLDF